MLMLKLCIVSLKFTFTVISVLLLVQFSNPSHVTSPNPQTCKGKAGNWFSRDRSLISSNFKNTDGVHFFS